MNRLAVLAIGTLLLLSASTLLAQHGGHGGGGGRRGSPGTGSGDTSDAGLADFNRALAVQANSDQMSHFPEVTKSTEAARKLAQDFSGMNGKAGSATEFSRRTAALKEAVEEAQGSGEFSSREEALAFVRRLHHHAKGGSALTGVGTER